MDKSDFRVLVRRQVGYEPMVAVRFEMNEGYGELYAGAARNVSPSAQGEQTDVAGEELRAGRFVHVLSSGRRRQSYALSRLDDERILRLADDRWTELVPITEFGIRYLEFPELGPTPQVAVVQVGAGDPPTPPSPRPSPVSSLPPSSSISSAAMSPTASLSPSSASPAPSRSASPAPSRSTAPAAARAASPASVAPAPRVAVSVGSQGSAPAPRAPVPATGAAPVARPGVPAARAAEVRPGSEPRLSDPRGPVPVERDLAVDAVARLGTEELRARLLAEMAKVRAVLDRVDELERQLDASRAREADLLEVLGRWHQRG